MSGRALSIIAAWAACLGATAAFAAGPARIARADRSQWPDTLDSPAAFDRASRAEILVFTAALAAFEARPSSERAQALGVRRIDAESLAAWRTRTLERLAEGFRRASAGCRADDVPCDARVTADELAARAPALEAALPEGLHAWRRAARAFHEAYLVEQQRLAALFPRTTSEIATMSERERTGFELGDRELLLTFDDGPTPPGGSTDRLLALLRQERRNGTFYMLGERLTARRAREAPDALRARFDGMCVASHGWRHESHQRMAAWEASVRDNERLLRDTFGPLHVPFFRPPYGQRTVESGAFFGREGLGVALWNIDSQDWTPALDAEDVAARVLTLVLLWRRGVILFHDVHDKARGALPLLWGQTHGAGLAWMDCRQYR